MQKYTLLHMIEKLIGKWLILIGNSFRISAADRTYLPENL